LEIDRHIFKPLIERIFDENMLNYPDPSIKGDMVVTTTGAVSLMVKETMADRRLAFLQTTNNPVDLKLMGYAGRATLLREAGKTLELAGQKIVQDEVEIERDVAQEQQAQAQSAQQELQLRQQQMQADLQIKQGQLQLQKAELDLKSRELQSVKVPAVGIKAGEARDRSDNASIKNYLDMMKAKKEPAKKGLSK
jgi:hypothetical protein